MDIAAIKDAIETKVYHLTAKMNVPLHQHDDQDEIFYCIKGAGVGVLENSETELRRFGADQRGTGGKAIRSFFEIQRSDRMQRKPGDKRQRRQHDEAERGDKLH